jgi:hypothetical protein
VFAVITTNRQHVIHIPVDFGAGPDVPVQGKIGVN